MAPARLVAYRVLAKVEHGGHASDLLLRETLHLDPRDAALAHEIVFGVLRFEGQLDHLIEKLASVKKLDTEVRLVLRMGVYQLRYLDRVPPHAAVDESVELVKRARKRSAAGFVNAVLRKVRRGRIRWPDRATELSLPPWLLDRWEARFGAEMAEKIARAALAPPETYIRIPPGKEHNLNAEPTGVSGCWRLRSGDAFGFRQMDIGSQSIVPLLELEPGQTFLDVCAAPGNKTLQALESGVRAVACDRSAGRLVELEGVDRVACDATRPLPFAIQFDRVLVDAPCSGTGTLARNPEIKWRLKESDLAAFQGRQKKILENALALLKPGGRLVYSTCSLEREENEDVVTGLPVVETRLRLPGRDPGDGFFAAVITSR